VDASRIRVVIADASDEVCHALRRLLSRARDIEVVGIAQSEASAIEALHSEQPDVLLIDFNLCHAVVLRPHTPLDGEPSANTKPLVLVVHPSDAASLGDVAWMLKDSGGGELRRRILEVAGRTPHSDEAAANEVPFQS